MKYELEYKNTTNKKEFINVMLKKYKKLKLATANRRYYDLRKKYKTQLIIKYPVYEKEIPQQLKLLNLNDMIKYGNKITRKMLYTYGWNYYEVNWLEEEKNETFK